MRSIVGFPDTVDEVSARLVAGGVVAIATVALLLDLPWLAVVLAVGFALRVAAGPRLSPLALLVTKVGRPRLDVAPRPVPGPPKRFAQAVGLAFSSASALLALAFGLETAGAVGLGALLVAASLEAFAGLCLGCKAFALLVRVGVVPADVCERCVAGPHAVR